MLLVSNEDMSGLARVCPGSKNAKHVCHQPIAGSHPGVGSICTYAGQYTHQFVQAVLETVPCFRKAVEASLVECDPCPSSSIHEVLATKSDLDSEQASDDQILKVLDRMRRNLGHPQDMA